MTTDALPACDLVMSRLRYEEKRICESLERAGIAYRVRDVRRLALPIHGPDSAWAPVVLNREISFTRARYVAHALDAAGVRALNDVGAIEVCGDKYRTSIALAAAGIPTPRTILAFDRETALQAMESLGYPVVVKPLVGSWGRLCARLRDRESAEAVLEHREALANPQHHVFYIQEHVAKVDRDIRLIVVGDTVLGGTFRRSDQWRTNVHRGAQPEAFTPSEELCGLALRAARTLGAVIAGVDVVEDDVGRLSVLEVNHGLEFHGFEAATSVDVAGSIVSFATRAVQEAA